MKIEYEAPAIRELGSLQKLTQQLYNKVGHAPDMYTQETSGVVVGSLVPVQ